MGEQTNRMNARVSPGAVKTVSLAAAAEDDTRDQVKFSPTGILPRDEKDEAFTEDPDSLDDPNVIEPGTDADPMAWKGGDISARGQ